MPCAFGNPRKQHALWLGLVCALGASGAARAPAPARMSPEVTPSPELAQAPGADPIEAYQALIRDYPHLVARPGDHHTHEIELVTGADAMRRAQASFERRYALHEKGVPAHAASRVGLLAQDPYLLVLREVVTFPSGAQGLYNRTLSRSTLDGGPPGAFCLPVTAQGKLLLSREYRHQERAWRLGLLGGFRDPGETAETAARREAVEESGAQVPVLALLGELDANGEATPLFTGRIEGPRRAVHPDDGEALTTPLEVTPQALRQIVAAGSYTDETGRVYRLHGVLGSALVMYEAWHAAHAEAAQAARLRPSLRQATAYSR